MQRVLNMVRKDLRRQLRSPMAILFVLSFPLVFTTMLALAFGSSGTPSVPKVQLLVEDLDDSLLSGVLVSMTSSEQMSKFFDVRQVGPEGLSLIEQNEASALWRIPQNLQADLLEGRRVEFELIRNPAQSILPEIAEQGLTVLAEVLSAAARVLGDPMEDLRSWFESGDSKPTAAEVAALSVKLYAVANRSEELLFPPVITFEAVQLTDDDGDAQGSGPSTGNLFLFVLPGISVWGLFLVGDLAMRDIIAEGRLGTLKRQLCGPIPAFHFVAGKALYTAVLSTLSLVVLATVGILVGRQAVDAVGFLVLSFALILAITGFSATMYGSISTERQGGTISSVLMLVFAFMGGSFFPVSSMPPALQNAAPFSPFYWGTTGYQSLVRGEGVSAVLVNAGVLATLGLVLLSLGAVLLRRKVHGGTA